MHTLLLLLTLLTPQVGDLDTVRIVAHDSVPLYATVYTPPNYTPDSVYPVLYLLHGIHGNHHSWEKQGHISEITDSLIANRLITPLVIVMPMCVVHDTTYAYRLPTYCHAMHDYLHHTKKGEFEAYFPEIENYIANHYAIKSPLPFLGKGVGERGSIAGLSAGAKQAVHIQQEAHFEVVGLFSPVVSDSDFPTDSCNCIYWIRGGGGDIFYPRARKANRFLTRQQFPHDFHRTKGRHNWNAWTRYIEEFLLFAFSIE